MKRGFTLIELIVVIAIIAVLSAMVLISVRSAKTKSRDAQRIANMSEINNALNLYENTNRQYPIYTGNITSSDTMSLALESAGTISQTPVDPLNSLPYVYTYSSSDGTTFTLGFCLETNAVQGYSQGCGHTITP